MFSTTCALVLATSCNICLSRLDSFGKSGFDKNVLLLNLFASHSLKELLQLLEPGYVIPSTTHVASLLRKQHDDGEQEVKRLVARADYVALTTDIWTSKATQAYATTTAHFVDENWKLVSAVLETVHFPESHTGINISQQLKGAVARFAIPTSKVVAVVHDEAANVELAG